MSCFYSRAVLNQEPVLVASIPYIQINFIFVFTKAMKHSFGLYKAIPSVEVGSSKQAVSKIAQG